MAKTAAKSMHNAILPQTGTKLTKKCSSEFGALLWRHLKRQRKPQYRCTPTIPTVHSCQKTFWKIYFLYDFWCTQTCSFRAIFGLPDV